MGVAPKGAPGIIVTLGIPVRFTPVEQEQNYTTQEVADLLGVHKNTVLNWIKAQKIDDPPRDRNNARVWHDHHLKRLRELRDGLEQLTLLD